MVKNEINIKNLQITKLDHTPTELHATPQDSYTASTHQNSIKDSNTRIIPLQSKNSNAPISKYSSSNPTNPIKNSNVEDHSLHSDVATDIDIPAHIKNSTTRPNNQGAHLQAAGSAPHKKEQKSGEDGKVTKEIQEKNSSTINISSLDSHALSRIQIEYKCRQIISRNVMKWEDK